MRESSASESGHVSPFFFPFNFESFFLYDDDDDDDETKETRA